MAKTQATTEKHETYPDHSMRTPWRKRTQIESEDQTMTKQSFQEECNINNIMAKYQKTGVIDHVQANKPEYGFATGLDFKESVDLIQKADDMFSDLPSTVRENFENDPSQFLDYAQDPANQDTLDYIYENGDFPPETSSMQTEDALGVAREPLATENQPSAAATGAETPDN